MLEKSSAQNVTACENQGKQCKLSDHWKLKTKRLNEIQVLTKKTPKESLRKQK